MGQATKTKKIFDGRYEILGIVGRGSQSVVYRACHAMVPGAEVALKVLVRQKQTGGRKSLNEKLRKEALAMVSARHNYVVRIDDFHSVDSLCYLSMEFAPLGDLRKYAGSAGGRLNVEQALVFFRQCCEALQFIHHVGMIHRDIKPDNILVMSEREIRLADFGVAVLPGEAFSMSELQKGIGTMDYMAPEVLEGREYRKPADLYSLGVAFYELLSGKHPFKEAVLAAQLDARKPGGFKDIKETTPDIPPYFADILVKCMQYDLVKRYATADQILADLEKRSVSLGSVSEAAQKAPADKTVQTTKSPENAVASTSAAPKNEPKKKPSQKRESFRIPERKSEIKPVPRRSETGTSEKIVGIHQAEPKESEKKAPPAAKQTASVKTTPTDKQKIAATGDIPLSEALKRSAPQPDSTMKSNRPKSERQGDQSSHPERTPAAQSAFTAGVSGTESNADFRKDKDMAKPKPDLSTTGKTESTNREHVKSAVKGKDIVPPLLTRKKPVRGKLIAALAVVGALIFYTFGGPAKPKQEQKAAVPESHKVDAREALAALNLGTGTESDASRSSADITFPRLPSGVYSGAMKSLRGRELVPLSIVSFGESDRISVITGIAGWTPATISTADLQEGEPLRIASNGMILTLTPSGVKNGWTTGEYTDVVTGARGNWSLKSQTKQ